MPCFFFPFFSSSPFFGFTWSYRYGFFFANILFCVFSLSQSFDSLASINKVTKNPHPKKIPASSLTFDFTEYKVDPIQPTTTPSKFGWLACFELA